MCGGQFYLSEPGTLIVRAHLVCLNHIRKSKEAGQGRARRSVLAMSCVFPSKDVPNFAVNSKSLGCLADLSMMGRQAGVKSRSHLQKL